jgi:hypothetical protein
MLIANPLIQVSRLGIGMADIRNTAETRRDVGFGPLKTQ